MKCVFVMDCVCVGLCDGVCDTAVICLLECVCVEKCVFVMEECAFERESVGQR